VGEDEQSLYDLLEVPELAGPGEISAAFRRAAKRWHPDLRAADAVEANERMKMISAAYEVLRDPERRAAYDLTLHVAPECSASAGSEDASDEDPGSPTWWEPVPGAVKARTVDDAGPPPGFCAAPSRSLLDAFTAPRARRRSPRCPRSRAGADASLSVPWLAVCPPLAFVLAARRDCDPLLARWASLYAVAALLWGSGAALGTTPVELLGCALWLLGAAHCIRWRARLAPPPDAESRGQPR
jgi:hypothetical protein